jgi:predicted nucleotidyltransferase
MGDTVMVSPNDSSVMKEMTMLDLSAVDLGEIATALEDHSYDGSWWIDATTGAVWYWRGEEDDDAEFDPDAREDARRIDPLPSSEGYGDMEDFIARLSDRRAADLLDRAIAGRGAFRRFKDTLFEFPDLRAAWFRFRDTRMQRRAIEFLVDERLVDEVDAARALADLDDPPVDGGVDVANPRDVAAAVAADLRRLYGERLDDVVLYGSQARGDAHPESDIDLAVILDEVASPWEELRRMDDILWRHTLESGLTVSAIPISRSAWAASRRPFMRAAKADGIHVG